VPSESESSPPSFDIELSDSDSVSSLLSFALLRFCPAFARGFLPLFAPCIPFLCLLVEVSVPVATAPIERGAFALAALPTLARFGPAALVLELTGVVGSSMVMDVFIPIMTLRFISWNSGVSCMPRADRFDVPIPEFMRLRIISVAAENWGTYLAGDALWGAPDDAPSALKLRFGGSILVIEG
jgi:hypothetical protein